MKIISPDYLNGIYNIHSNNMEDLIGHSVISLENEIKEVNDTPNYFPM